MLSGSKEEPASLKPLYDYCTIRFYVCNQLIINKILVEAAGVELSCMLTARRLLIPGSATPAKKAPLPDPLYVYCTKMLLARESKGQTYRPQYSIDSAAMDLRKSAQRSFDYRKSPPSHFRNLAIMGVAVRA